MARGKVSNDIIEFILKANGSQLQEEIHSTDRHMKELEKQYDDLLRQQAAMVKSNAQETKEYKALIQQIKEKKQAIADDKAKIAELTKAVKVDEMTMAQLRKEAARLKKQLDNTAKSADPKTYESLQRRLGEVTNRMRDLRRSTDTVTQSLRSNGTGLRGFFDNIRNATTNFSGMKTLLSSGALLSVGSIAGGVIGGAVVQGIKTAVENAKVFYDFSVEIEEARRLTREFLNVEGKELTEASSQLQAIAKQTGREYKEVLNATDTLMKQFGIDAEQAYTAIKDGIEAGADENGTLLSQIQQYAPAFRDAGISVQELIALITQTRSGIFNEQGMALIQTATSRIRTMSTATRKALDEIGISSEQLQKDLTSGDKSIIEAIRQISERIGELPENSREVGEALKEVFGRTASNGGMQLVKELATINTDMNKLKEVTGEYGSLQRKQIDLQAELNKKMADTFGIGEGGFEKLTAKYNIFNTKVLIKTTDYLRSLYDRIGIIRGAVEAVRVTVDALFKACEITIMETLRLTLYLLKGIGDLVELAEKFVKGIVTMDFSGVAEAWQHIKDDTAELWNGMVNDAKDIGKRFGDNLAASMQRSLYGHTLKAPAVEAGTLDEVVVTPGSNKKATSTTSPTDPKSTANPKTATSKTKSTANPRQDALNAEQAQYQASLQALRKSLADKQVTQQQYDALTLAAATASAENRLEIERQFLKEAQQMDGKDAADKEKRIKDQERNVAQAEQAANEARLRQYEQFRKQMDAIESQGMDEGEKQEQAYRLQLQTLKAYYDAARQYAVEHNEDTAAIDDAYMKARERITADHERSIEQKKAQARQQYGLTTQQQLFDQEMAQLKAQYDQKLLSEEQYQKALQLLRKKYDDQNLQTRQQYGIASVEETRQHEMEMLERQHADGKLSEEQYQQALQQLRQQYMKADFDQYAQLFGGAVQALQDAELANIDAKYDAEIEAARQAGEDVSELENRKENEKLKVQKKYADVNFAIKASQIVADTAVAIMKALGELGPIAGPIAAALMGVTGAAQLAAANAERQKVKSMTLSGTSSGGSATRVATGLWRGGAMDTVYREQDGKAFHPEYAPGRRGYVENPTVIVGDGPFGQSKEWVASNAAVNNPTVRPFLDILDHAQQAGSIGTLDMNKYLRARPLIGRASGGGIANTTNSTNPTNPTTTPTTDPILSRLADTLEQGITAIVALDEIDAQQKLRERARDVARK